MDAMEQLVEEMSPDDTFSATEHSSPFTLLHQFLKNPRETASVVPSGKQLAELMASAIPGNGGHIIEIGAGTGVITEAILRKGVPPSSLYVIEMNPVLHGVLRSKFPMIQMGCGDARHLASMTSEWRGNRSNVDAICSSLGLLSMPPTIRNEILTAAFSVLRPDGVFVQYTYGYKCPIGATARKQFQLEHHPAGLAWRNLPPARVFVYRRAGASK